MHLWHITIELDAFWKAQQRGGKGIGVHWCDYLNILTEIPSQATKYIQRMQTGSICTILQIWLFLTLDREDVPVFVKARPSEQRQLWTYDQDTKHVKRVTTEGMEIIYKQTLQVKVNLCQISGFVDFLKKLLEFSKNYTEAHGEWPLDLVNKLSR